MTIYCPRCGEPGRDEAAVSFVSVWASCAHCELVWRSSLLKTLVGYAVRAVGLGRNQKRYEARNKLDAAVLQQPSESLPPVSVDRVAEWLATQERTIGVPRLAVVPHSSADAETIEGMFDDIQLSVTAAAYWDESEDVHPVAESAAEVLLDTSADRALRSVEDLYEAFKRLEQQLGTISDSLQTYNQRP